MNLCVVFAIICVSCIVQAFLMQAISNFQKKKSKIPPMRLTYSKKK